MLNAIYKKNIEQFAWQNVYSTYFGSASSQTIYSKVYMSAFSDYWNRLGDGSSGKTKNRNEQAYLCWNGCVGYRKTVVYAFHYLCMLQKYSLNNVSLLFTDTDCLTHVVQTEDLWRHKTNAQPIFDYSNYAKLHMLYRPIRQYVALRVKTYKAF